MTPKIFSYLVIELFLEIDFSGHGGAKSGKDESRELHRDVTIVETVSNDTRSTGKS